MLNEVTISKIKSIGFNIKKSQDKFVEVLKRALKELGGKEWRKGELPPLFRQLEREVVVPLCLDADGPMLSRDTFRHYMAAARKSLLFGIPFQMANRVSYDDLPMLNELVENDKTDRCATDKVKDAIRLIKQKKRNAAILAEASVRRITLPTADDGQHWVKRFVSTLSEVLEAAKVVPDETGIISKLTQAIDTGKECASDEHRLG